MLVPIEWLKQYVEIDIPTQELGNRLTMTGSKVEAVKTLGEDIQKVVVGKILSVDPHPNADKLVVCKVDIGSEILQIVTGAPNVEVGMLVPVATSGAILPGGTKIKSGKLRGVVSQGMMCSGEELELTDGDYPGAEAYGIMALREDYPLGMDIKDALELGGEVIEFEITSNRPDCLSVVGIARETSVTLGSTLKPIEIKVEEGIGDISDEVSVIVKENGLCPRYCARVVKDIKIGPSPRWMRRRLAAAGIRPINNIVDITNYVMLEMGQPMHAFDLDKVANREIIVRRAMEGEKLVTLDDQERELTPDMLVIADSEKPIALAGVMGGANSEITSTTRNIVLESAKFDGTSIRLTSKALNLRSEASSRFEKGVDICNVEDALDRAAQLIQQLGVGTVVNGKTDVCSATLEPRILEVPWKRINQLLGLDLTVESICSVLESLGFKTQQSGNTLKVDVPPFRQDVEGVADLAEEVARIYGYNNIPMTLMEHSVSKASKTRHQILTDYAKEVLTGMGLYEVVTYSFTSPRVYGTIGLKKEEYPPAVKIANPLGEDQSIMRTTLIPSILEVLSRNFNRRLEKCQVFELSNVFIPKSIPLKELPIEKTTLIIGEYGEGLDYYDLKGKVELLLDTFGILKDTRFIPHTNPTFHPGRTAAVRVGDEDIGVIGEIHPKVAENYEMSTRVLIGELDFDRILDFARTEKRYEPLPKFPEVTRDLAIVVEKGVLADRIEHTIKRVGGKLLEKVELFDIYEGSQIPPGFKSMAYALSYRAADRTLKDEEVNAVHQRIIDELRNVLGARLR